MTRERDRPARGLTRVRSGAGIWFATVIALAAVTIVLLGTRQGVGDAVRATRWWGIAGALGLAGLSALGEGAVLASLSGSLRPAHVLRMTRAYVAGGFAGAVTPYALGGGPAWIWALHREGVSVGEAGALVAARAIVSALFFALMCIVAAIMAPLIPGVPRALALAVIVPIGLSAAALFVVRQPDRAGRRLASAVQWIGRHLGSERIQSAAAHVPAEIVRFGTTLIDLVGRRPGALVGALFWLALSRLGQLVAIPLLLAAQGQHLQPSTVLAGLATVWVALSVIPAPGGEGIAQGLVLGVFGVFADARFAAATALLWRATVFYPLLVIGGLLFARLVRSRGIEPLAAQPAGAETRLP